MLICIFRLNILYHNNLKTKYIIDLYGIINLLKLCGSKENRLFMKLKKCI